MGYMPSPAVRFGEHFAARSVQHHVGIFALIAGPEADVLSRTENWLRWRPVSLLAAFARIAAQSELCAPLAWRRGPGSS